MTLGNKIRSLREQQNMTQKELATAIGVATGIIAEWEADEATPNLAGLSGLSKALSVSADVLLDTTTEDIVAPVSEPKQEQAPVSAPPKKRRKTGLIVGIAVVCVVVVAVAIFLLIQFANPKPFSEDTAAIEKADASVVKVFCYDHDGNPSATGSGFVAFDGKTIITNYHVMTSAYTCKISTNQDISYNVSGILSCSEKYDIAILQLAEDTGLRPLTLGDSTSILKGETVVAIGSPLGIKNTVSTGVLSGRLMDANMDVLQFTAPISSGSSGGALFDNSGNVIGITYASYVDGQNLNLAIPIELAMELYKNKGQTKEIAAIYKTEHPYAAWLVAHKNDNVPKVTLSQLQQNPPKYDNKYIILTTYISSLAQNEEWGKSRLFVAEKSNVSFNSDYDFAQHISSKANFEDKSIMSCYLTNCVIPNEAIKAGDKIVIIGIFEYGAIGEPYWWGEGSSSISSGHIDAKYIYLDS